MTTKNLSSSSPQALLRLTEVKAITGMGKTLIYRLIAQDRFPSPIHPAGSRISAWVTSEIENWIADQVRASREAQK